MSKLASGLVTLSLMFTPTIVSAQTVKGEIYSEDRDAAGAGVTVVRLWGTPYERGYAHGNLLAARIVGFLAQARGQLTGQQYSLLRTVANGLDWLDPAFDDELAGVLAGILAKSPTAALDLTDLKLVSGMGDWGYLCRSHAAWGSRVAAPYESLATRRLDYGTGFDVERDHVLFVVKPEVGPSFVNVAWPGFVGVVTGVNEYGTLVSLHDYESATGVPGTPAASRAAIARLGLERDWGGDVSTHLAAFEAALSTVQPQTGTFVNFYAPNGAGGVITCLRDTGCAAARTPQSDYYGGEVLVTTNSDTTGHQTPIGGEFMATYYNDSTPKTLQSHFDLMGNSGLHLFSVGYRAASDMTLWFKGQATTGTTSRLELEWTTLFQAFSRCNDHVIGPGEHCGATTPSDYRPSAPDEGCAATPPTFLAVLAVACCLRRRMSSVVNPKA
ncbi:MAG: hypothetical protein HY903_14745 [Deltaproteobacteria bacterium]|nr:hypothetical protein [Deltaproteobacteria bacterium]